MPMYQDIAATLKQGDIVITDNDDRNKRYIKGDQAIVCGNDNDGFLQTVCNGMHITFGLWEISASGRSYILKESPRRCGKTAALKLSVPPGDPDPNAVYDPMNPAFRLLKLSVPPGDAEQTIADRDPRYGDFAGRAGIAQALQGIMRDSPMWRGMMPDQQQALTEISGKISRLLNGDPNDLDSWHDIAGYATLVEQRLCAQGAHAAAMEDA